MSSHCGRRVNCAARYVGFGTAAVPNDTARLDLDAGDGKRLIGLTGRVTVIHKGVEVPCTVEDTDNGIGFIVQGQYLECLFMTLQPRRQIAKISALRAERNSCPLKEDMPSKGAFLLGLAEELCAQVGIHTALLDDSSHVTTRDGLSVDLQFLSVMRHGASWYERHGYITTCDVEGGREQAIAAVRLASVAAICEFLGKFGSREQASAKVRWVDEYRVGEMLDFAASKALIETQETLSVRDKRRVQALAKADARYDSFFDNLAARVSLFLEWAERYKKVSDGDHLCDFLDFVWAKSSASYVSIARMLFPSLDLPRRDNKRHLFPRGILRPFPHCTSMSKVISPSSGNRKRARR